ncbi:hypothetical protein CEUSTIGMA_g8205.t1 [Chlamydomonas eustigma]|uniref:Thioesterase domain-containing protein n=1 Tax=Chlamydomonas eustigma TaxID=1157962 RepID=A0A250XDD2_9CHLO|nr:hypothetical protein CEUSTIGMA_g8205.t1 [Chlamydomonas eustigma]|eukprot:GAX80770.1 hypothetical protein CEUSTIGMA_g8205.t1 [Chlamydomonas eustigma]
MPPYNGFHAFRSVFGSRATSRRTRGASATSSGAGPGLPKRVAFRLGSAAVLGSGAYMAWQLPNDDSDFMDLKTSNIPWVQDLAAKESVQEVLNPGQMLRQNLIGKLLVEQDHLFEAMIQSGQILEFRCFYEPTEKRFHSVVQLGRDVCGFPQTVHGGLTAAIMDETFGGLGVCLWKSGALGFRPPAYTARLEVDYKKKIPAGTVIKCSTGLQKVEDRKVSSIQILL